MADAFSRFFMQKAQNDPLMLPERKKLCIQVEHHGYTAYTVWTAER